MAGAVRGIGFVREASAFAEAANDAGVESIETMIRLALTAHTPGIRRWAATWLAERYSVRVAA